jgi:hypothetical protein
MNENEATPNTSGLGVGKLFLRRVRVYKQFALVDPQTGRVEFATIAERPNINGLFEMLDGAFVALYLCQGDFVIQVNDERVILADDVVVTMTRAPVSSQLRIERGDVVTQVTYQSPMPDPILALETFQRVEDYDFGTWLTNICASVERREILRSSWADYQAPEGA